MTTQDFKKAAAELAAALTAGGATITPELRAQFIALRTALFERGVYDPVLARFDSATVAQATPAEIAQQLEKVAEALS